MKYLGEMRKEWSIQVGWGVEHMAQVWRDMKLVLEGFRKVQSGRRGEGDEEAVEKMGGESGLDL